MLGVSYQGPWQLDLVERQEPTIQHPDHILVKVAATGICGTDLGIASGQYSAKQGVILGHEFSGTVIATGANVMAVKPGDRVFVDPTYSCGHCEMCTTERPNHCIEKSETETGVSADGAFAPYYVTTDRFVSPMSDTTSFEAATLAEPFSCALTGVNQVKVRPDDQTVILGAGPMGIMYAHALALKGVRGTVVEISSGRRELVKEALPDGWKVAARFEDAVSGFRNGRCDLVVDTTAVMTEKVIPYLNRGGRIILVGLRRNTAKIDPAELADKSISLIGSIDSIGTFPLACRLIDQGRLPAEKIITKSFGLADFREAFAELGTDLRAKRQTTSAMQIKIVLKPEQN
jgi:threonine dehydrogenase-like Zn-dependent dehydrogenase